MFGSLPVEYLSTAKGTLTIAPDVVSHPAMIRHLWLLFSLVLASGSADDINAQFEKFVTKHNRTYDAAEYARRFVIFEANLKHIEAHKQRGVKSLGINHFADWEPEEWHKVLAVRFTAS